MTFQTIIVDVSPDGVATVTLNRPEVLNAFNDAMCAEFAQLWSQVRADDQIRAVVLAAAGDRAFCTGVDVSERLDSDSPFLDRAQPWAEHEDPGRDLSPRRNEVWKPVIAAVHGMCAGGAFYWIADCDIVICSPDATFFDPHVTYGFVAALEPIALRYRMPFSDVMRMALLGLHERMTAERALAAGLVTEIVDRDRVARARPRTGTGDRRPTRGRRAGHREGPVAVARRRAWPGSCHGAHVHPGREPDRDGAGRSQRGEAGKTVASVTASAELSAADVDQLPQEFPLLARAHTESELAANPAKHDQHIAEGLVLSRALWEAGWKRFGWPESLGGLGGGPRHRATYYDELCRAGLELPDTDLSIEVIAPALLRFAPALAEAYLPRFLAGEEAWAQAFSEPDAGSDLAALRTRGVVEGDQIVVDGQKVWTSHGHLATRLLVLVRTGTPESRHRGPGRAAGGWRHSGSDPASVDVRQRCAGDVRDLLPGCARPDRPHDRRRD